MQILKAFFTNFVIRAYAQGGNIPEAPPAGGGGLPEGPPAPGQLLPDPLGGQTITDVLCRIGGWLFYVSIPLTAIMIIIGAFQIMFAGGNEEKVATGRRTIIYTVVGFAIILSATGIIYVIQELLGTSGAVCGGD